MVWACDEKRGTLGPTYRKEGDQNKSTGREEYLREDSWATSRMISKRRDCRLMKCTAVLHGGV